MNILKLAVSAASLVLVSAGGCLASESPDVSAFKIDLDNGWRLYPAMTGSRLVGFLAEQVAGTAAPLGYSLVWLERQADDTFSLRGYDGVKPADAATKVELALGQPELFSHCEFESGVVGVITEPGSSLVEMQDGLAITDPLQPIATEMPGEVLEEYVLSLGAGRCLNFGASGRGGCQLCGPERDLGGLDPTRGGNHRLRWSRRAIPCEHLRRRRGHQHMVQLQLHQHQRADRPMEIHIAYGRDLLLFPAHG